MNQNNSDNHLPIISKKFRRILLLAEPIIIGLILFPSIVLFWQSGWNLILIILDLVNKYLLQTSEQLSQVQKKSNVLPDSLFLIVHRKSKHNDFVEESIVNLNGYSLQSLIITYIIIQIFLLWFYLGQDFFYNFLTKQNNITRITLLKYHIFLSASIYIAQWVVIWTIWDQYTSSECDFELLLTFAFLFLFMIFNGHISDLICSPFITSYDSIEYCLRIDCSLSIKNVSWI